MLFVYLDHKIAVLILGKETCLKHFSSRHPGVGTAFYYALHQYLPYFIHSLYIVYIIYITKTRKSTKCSQKKVLRK